MIRALVLAAGSATRLRPLSPDLPKPLAPVANRPVLGWVLDHLDTAAVTEIGVIVPAGAVGLYERVLGAFTQAGTPITWLGEEAPVGSAGALRDQRGFFDGGPVLVVPADIICPVDLSGMIAHHAAHRRAVTVAVSPRDPRTWDGDILVPHPGFTARYLFKPGPQASSRLGSTGTWLVEPALLDRIPPTGCVDLSSQTLPALPPSEVGLFDTGEVYLRDVGTLPTLLRGNLEAVQQENGLPLPPPLPGTRVMVEPGALIEDGAVVDGPVLIGGGARVRSGAHVVGPVVVGPGAVLGAGCRVERALVLPGAVVRPHERVAGRVVGDGAAAVRALPPSGGRAVVSGPLARNRRVLGVPAQIAGWAATTPEATAVTCDGRSWTYRQLATAAAWISGLLADAGTVPGQVIAVIAERGLPLVAAWTAVLDQRAVLLPIDPLTPPPRREEMLERAGTALVLLAGRVPAPPGRRVIHLDDLPGTPTPPRPLADAGPAVDGGYVCFTSGSTGAPKAIAGRHDSLTHFLQWQRRTFAVGAADRVAQLASVEFDPALREMFLPLTCGAVLCLPPTGPFAPDEALAWLAREHVTLAHVVPTVARAWLRAAPAGLRLPQLRTVLFGGEPLTGALVERWREQLAYRGQVVNLYGPTETTLARCWHPVSDPAEPGVQPLGTPIDDTEIRIEDPGGCLVEDGTIGEIVIATRYGTDGYLDPAAEEAARFTFAPGGMPGDVVYRTGDLGRWDEQRRLRFCGRSDDQVKVYGVRVQLRAVEAVLEEQPGIAQAAVVAEAGGDDGPPRLTAFLVLDPGQPAIPAQLRGALRRRLPAAAIPARFQTVTALPVRQISGKLDRRSLPGIVPHPGSERTT